MEEKIVQLNLEGEICPYPLIISLKKFQEIKKEVEAGEKIMEIITDCPPAAENVPAEYKKRGLDAKIEKIDISKWKIIIKKLIK